MVLPPGIPHSIQGLADGCRFLLVFDDAGFSENHTFPLTGWITHTPPDVLAKNFGVSETAFAKVPPNLEQQRYIFPGEVPQPRRAQAVRSPQGAVPRSVKFRLADQAPIRVAAGSWTSSRAACRASLAPERHGWRSWVERRGRMTVFASSGNARIFDLQAGDVGYVPEAIGHYNLPVGTLPPGNAQEETHR